MLSILIPIYNENVVKLVDNLIGQCIKAKVSFEILCLDDGSKAKIRDVNREINGRIGVNYVELTENIGRARIRNRLCKLARYDWLLYLDCDCKPSSKKFIKKYIQAIQNEGIYIGGTSYTKVIPKSIDKQLHWHYGTKREALTAKKKNRRPAQYFHTNNFLIRRDIMIAHPFDQKIKGYGYEDLALGHKLLKKDIPIIHIDNTVIHKGIKNSEDFLKDQKNAVNNLAALYKSGSIHQSRLINAYELIEKSGLRSFLYSWISNNEAPLQERLLSHPKRLFRLDLLKLLYFDKAINITQTEANDLD